MVRAMKVRAVPTPLSPVLANVYLHYVLDLWFEEEVKPLLAGEALLCRFADDWVCAFRYQEDAERFYRVLPKRLEKMNLKTGKGHRGSSDGRPASDCRRPVSGSRNGYGPTGICLGREFFQRLNSRLQGHYNYYGVRGNARSLY